MELLLVFIIIAVLVNFVISMVALYYICIWNSNLASLSTATEVISTEKSDINKRLKEIERILDTISLHVLLKPHRLIELGYDIQDYNKILIELDELSKLGKSNKGMLKSLMKRTTFRRAG